MKTVYNCAACGNVQINNDICRNCGQVMDFVRDVYVKAIEEGCC